MSPVYESSMSHPWPWSSNHEFLFLFSIRLMSNVFYNPSIVIFFTLYTRTRPSPHVAAHPHVMVLAVLALHEWCNVYEFCMFCSCAAPCAARALIVL